MARSTGSECTKLERLCGVAGSFFLLAARLGVAAANGALAQRLNVCKQVLAGLLAQHLAQQRAQRTDIAPQRCFLQVADRASSSASRCDQLSGFQKRAIVF